MYEEYSGEKNICNTPDLLCSGSLPPITFSRARDFWATADENGIVTVNGRGIAQYTNRNFVSAGTNFQGSLEHIEPYPGLPFPNGEEASIERKEVGDPELGNLQLRVDGQFLTLDTRPLNGKLFFVGTPVVDTYLGGTATTLSSQVRVRDVAIFFIYIARSQRRKSIGIDVCPSRVRSARISPRTLANLNP